MSLLCLPGSNLFHHVLLILWPPELYIDFTWDVLGFLFFYSHSTAWHGQHWKSFYKMLQTESYPSPCKRASQKLFSKYCQHDKFWAICPQADTHWCQWWSVLANWARLTKPSCQLSWHHNKPIAWGSKACHPEEEINTFVRYLILLGKGVFIECSWFRNIYINWTNTLDIAIMCTSQEMNIEPLIKLIYHRYWYTSH